MPWNRKKYARINWKNRPSTATALGATNLNKMDQMLNDVDNQLVEFDTSKLNVDVANGMLKSLTIDTKTGKIQATELGGTTHDWDLNLEKIPAKFELSEDGILTMTTDDGEKYTVNVAELIKAYDFTDSDTIDFTKSGQGPWDITAIVKAGSIKAEHLDPDWREDVQQFKNDAESAAADSLQYSKDSKRWAVGDESVPDSDTDNSKYYKEQAEVAKEAAELARDEAQAATGAVVMAPGVLGVGKPDDVTVKVDEDGTISIPKATVEAEGIVRADESTIAVNDGTLSLIATASQIPATDTSELLPEEESITTQKLLDAIADRIVKELVTNSKLTETLADYVTKAMMSNEDVNDKNKVPTSAFINSLVTKINANETAISTLNSETLGTLVFNEYVETPQYSYIIKIGKIVLLQLDMNLKDLTDDFTNNFTNVGIISNTDFYPRDTLRQTLISASGIVAQISITTLGEIKFYTSDKKFQCGRQRVIWNCN